MSEEVKMIRRKFSEKAKLEPAKKAGKNDYFDFTPKWDEKYKDAIRYFASKGYTNRQMAKKFHVHVSTFTRWLEDKPDVLEAYQAGKDEINQQIEQAFAKLATGFSHPDVEVYVYRGQPIVIPIEKYYPPNAYAAYKWLTMQAKDKWNDSQKIDVTHNINVSEVDMEDYSNEELLALEKMGMAQLVRSNVN
jgi:hypothetical protein